MDRINWKKEVFTLPNLLSLLRLLMIPGYALVYLRAASPGQYLLAAALLALSCLTDGLDGWIARRFSMCSMLGRLLDPVADKATQLAMICCLMVKKPGMHRFLLPMLVLFLLKEGFQLAAMAAALGKGLALPGALWPGKVCTCALFTGFIVTVLLPQLPERLLAAVAIGQCCFLAFAFAGYVLAYLGGKPMLQQLRQKTD